MSSSEPPSGPNGKSGIELLYFNTPSSHKGSIILEELKAAYGKEYVLRTVNIAQGENKQPWFLKYSPMGKFPAIIDHDRNGFSVFETGAILAYLTRHVSILFISL